jgi:hypothetical protein
MGTTLEKWPEKFEPTLMMLGSNAVFSEDPP